MQNIFFCPQEETEPDYGYIEMKMLHAIGDKSLENIAVVKLYATDMYKLYLKNTRINNMSEYIPNVACKPIYNQNFANRMLAYLRGISKASQAAANQMEMKSEKGKLIYPKRIKRELGAKVIYDTICPVAANTFYHFKAFTGEYGDMVAEDMGNSIALCEQIAEAAIELEGYICFNCGNMNKIIRCKQCLCEQKAVAHDEEYDETVICDDCQEIPFY